MKVTDKGISTTYHFILPLFSGFGSHNDLTSAALFSVVICFYLFICPFMFDWLATMSTALISY